MKNSSAYHHLSAKSIRKDDPPARESFCDIGINPCQSYLVNSAPKMNVSSTQFALLSIRRNEDSLFSLSKMQSEEDELGNKNALSHSGNTIEDPLRIATSYEH